MLSTDIRADAAGTSVRVLRRSGFCGMRTAVRLAGTSVAQQVSHPAQGETEIDLEAFDALQFRVLGDGRKYLATLRTDSWVAVPVRLLTPLHPTRCLPVASCARRALRMTCGRHFCSPLLASGLWSLSRCLAS